LPARSPLAHPAMNDADKRPVAPAAHSWLISRRDSNFISRFLEVTTARRGDWARAWVLIDGSEDRA
jgi:hypothetical protein